MNSPQKIAIIGAGPMAMYTLKELIKNATPLDLTVFEAAVKAGCGMPYRAGMNADYMYCNAFSKEIPPITRRLVTWLDQQDDAFLKDWDLERSDIGARDFYPRNLIGEFLSAEFDALCKSGKEAGHKIQVLPDHRVSDIIPSDQSVTLRVISQGVETTDVFGNVILATGHDWPSSPRIDEADLVSPWPYTNVTDLPPKAIGILGSSLSAIDVIVALGTEHGEFQEDGSKISWFPHKGREKLAVTMISHKGIMPEPDFYYPYPYEPLIHVNENAVLSEVKKGSDGLLQRVFALLVAELNEVAPDYMARLGPDAQTIEGFPHAYFKHREELGGLRALRETLNTAIKSMEDKITIPHRYALLRGHENFDLILDHLDADDRQRFNDALMPVFGDCYAAIPHISVRRVLALYDAGILELLPTGEGASFRNIPDGGVSVATVDGTLEFHALVDARGQAAANLRDLPFPGLVDALADPDSDLTSPFKLKLSGWSKACVYCLSMPQVLKRHPFSQGLPNCEKLGRKVAQEILHQTG